MSQRARASKAGAKAGTKAGKKAGATPGSKGNRAFLGLLGVVVVLGLGAIGFVASRPAPAAVVIDPNAPLPEAKGHTRGSETAPVEIIMFADFECPACGQFANITEPDVISRLVNTGLARLTFIDYPVAGHPSTRFAHNAAACAGAQGKFWEMHDRIFAGQHEWSEFMNGRDMNAPRVLKRYAGSLGLDQGVFNACFDSRQHEPQIHANYNHGSAAGVQYTPSFRIGKRLVPGAQPYDVIKALVDSATAEGAAGSGVGADR
jgi:protein-disulfide isomerase